MDQSHGAVGGQGAEVRAELDREMEKVLGDVKNVVGGLPQNEIIIDCVEHHLRHADHKDVKQRAMDACKVVVDEGPKLRNGSE